MELNGRVVVDVDVDVDVEVDGVDSTDYPDFCDAFFSYAAFEDNGEALTDEELDELRDLHSDVLCQMAYETLI